MSIYTFDNNDYDFYKYIGNIYKNNYKGLTSLENIHKLLETSALSETDKEYYNTIPDFGKDRNSVFVKKFHEAWDTDYTYTKLYIDFIVKYVKPLFPNETKILVQKTPNIRFHLPNCSNIGKRSTDPTSNIIGMHSDNEFGHPSEEVNIIIPITEMYNSNSIFYQYDSGFTDLKLNRNEFAVLKLNKLKHYNCINYTTITRVSFDTRVIPYSKYNKSVENSKFVPGDYYMII
jgi:hypothetical protein